MPEWNLNIENILNKLSKENLSGDKIANIFNNPKEFPKEIIEKLSIEIALKFWNNKLDYKSADYIMNNLFSFWLSNEYYFKNHEFSGISLECYNAFDAGEYYHNEDDRDIDPVEKYTKPGIEKLLRKLKQI